MLKRFVCALSIAGLMAVPARAETVDLELVLAVDASSSIDIGEYALQLRGIARGFRDPAVRAAIRSGPEKRIAVNVLIWGQQKYKKQSTGWRILSSNEDAEDFARMVEVMPRRQFGGTGIGEALVVSVASIAENGIEAGRSVIDVSGDGRETFEQDVILLPEAREIARHAGIIVNGLAVTNEEEDLLYYFAEDLVEGPGCFAMSAVDYFAFENAMRRKLFREIVAPGVSMATPPTAQGLF